MKRIPVLIDTDAGVDDAVALLAALKLPEMDVKAVTSVAGNVDVENTTRNALTVLEMAGREDIPLYRGASGPILRDRISAEEIHGKNGFNDMQFDVPVKKPEDRPAFDAIYDIAEEAGGELTVILLGPMTNLALALAKYKKLPGLLKRIVFMGGAASYGNATPAAEFNVFADPEAADMVMTCGTPFVMCGLDVTMKAYFLPEEMEALGASGRPVAKFVRDVTKGVMKFSLADGLPGMCMHDPLAVLYAADDSMFKSDSAWVRVETKGKITYGKTVTDVFSDKQMSPQNATVVLDVDREAFRDRLTELITSY